MNNGVLTHYHGDYQYYLDKSAAIAAAIAASAVPAAPPGRLRAPRARNKNGQKPRRVRPAPGNVAHRNRSSATSKKKSPGWKQKQKELAAELEKPETYDKPGRAVAVNRELSHVTEDLMRAIADWEQAAARVNELKPALKPDLAPS